MAKKPRILCYDIETSPIISYNWGIWEQNAIEIIEDWQILSVAYRWLGEKKVYCVAQCDFPNYKPGVNNDTNVVKFMHGLFNEADIVVAHNGDSFDAKKARSRMLIRGLQPPSPYKQIDTKLIAKRVGAFTSNRLKDLANDLDIARKGDPGGFETWKGCLMGNPRAWARMKRYNKLDIPPLEELYLRLRPWMTNHPSVAILSDKPDGCPKCGHTVLQSRGSSVTSTGKKQRYQCQGCGGWSYGRKIEKAGNLYVN